MVDSHAHLHFEKYVHTADEVIERAKQHRVTKIICVGCSVSDSQKAVIFSESRDNVWATVGAHPHDGQDFLNNLDTSLQILKSLAESPKVVAIGEIGLDYFHSHSSKKDQARALRAQIEMGLPIKKPFVFHVRDAWEDFWPILDSYSGITGVVHSFSADQVQLNEILKRDLLVGINGIMTFTKDQRQLDAAKKIPLDRMLLETDAPFLTPAPFRGTICESYHIRVIAEFISNLIGVSLEDLASATTKNAVRLFSLS